MGVKLNKYIELEAARAGVSYEEAQKRMDDVKERFGVSYQNFHEKKFFHADDLRIKKALKTHRSFYDNLYKEIEEESGWPIEKITELRANYKKLTKYTFTYVEIKQFRIWELPKKEAIDLAYTFKKYRSDLEDTIALVTAAFIKGDNVEESCAKELDNIKAYLPTVVSTEKKELAIAALKDGNTDVDFDDAETLEKVVYDMELMNRVFNYTYVDYVAYDMIHKTINERVEYLTHGEKLRYQERVNDRIVGDILDSKWESYLKFKDLYKRDVVSISRTEAGLHEFEDFCKKHSKFVFKPLVASKGNGIKMVTVPEEYELEAFFEETLEEYDDVLLEELIVQNESIGCFNPDTVNTVRIITLLKNNEINYLWPFIRVGRSGQFVDNASAGGIFAIVDSKTGVVITDGYDYNGATYEKHPDTQVTFKGYQVDNWSQLRMITENLARRIPEVRYVGWDMTLNENGDWVVVEANLSPGCRAYQAATGIGIRREFLNLLDVNESEVGNIVAIISRKRRLAEERKNTPLYRRAIRKVRKKLGI